MGRGGRSETTLTPPRPGVLAAGLRGPRGSGGGFRFSPHAALAEACCLDRRLPRIEAHDRPCAHSRVHCVRRVAGRGIRPDARDRVDGVGRVTTPVTPVWLLRGRDSITLEFFPQKVTRAEGAGGFRSTGDLEEKS